MADECRSYFNKEKPLHSTAKVRKTGPSEERKLGPGLRCDGGPGCLLESRVTRPRVDDCPGPQNFDAEYKSRVLSAPMDRRDPEDCPHHHQGP